MPPIINILDTLGYHCVTRTFDYGPPCFLNIKDEPQCTYEITECGLKLFPKARNAKTAIFFEVASATGLPDVLSEQDFDSYFLGK